MTGTEWTLPERVVSNRGLGRQHQRALLVRLNKRCWSEQCMWSAWPAPPARSLKQNSVSWNSESALRGKSRGLLKVTVPEFS